MPRRLPRLGVKTALLSACVLVLGVVPAGAQQRPPYGPGNSADPPPSVPGFGQVEGVAPIPGFGTDAEAWAVVTAEDLSRAEERLRSYDRDHDRYIDREEARRASWHGDPFQYDKDGDQRLSKLELAVRYADRRLEEADGGGPPGSSSAAQRAREEQQRREQERREQERREQERRAEEAARRDRMNAMRGSWHLTETLMSRYDANHDGQLDSQERRSLGISLSADTDGDQRINRPELAQWLADREAEQGDYSRDLPDWFVERDTDGDGQVAMSEFTDEWTEEKIKEFAQLDTNDDGILMPDECLRAIERLNEKHANRRFQVIPTKGAVRAEITVDLDVQVSITHTHDDHLRGYLIGPDGERVELFANVGGEDDHFENTIFDEESPLPIVRGRPPFHGRFQTGDLLKGRGGLKQFYGRSPKGTWTLLIEAFSDRPGALHGWSLILRTAEEDQPATDEFD
jgi:subtilisin-like proprotein convertase family protein/Ca2+-binding EF-hand superfamily protein